MISPLSGVSRPVAQRRMVDLSLIHILYKAEQHSYRDLPIRLGETSTLFRNEDSGEMHGLTRVRQFTISEGHLIVRPDQMVKEFKDCIALAQYCLQVLGVEEDVTYQIGRAHV